MGGVSNGSRAFEGCKMYDEGKVIIGMHLAGRKGETCPSQRDEEESGGEFVRSWGTIALLEQAVKRGIKFNWGLTFL